MRKKAIAVILMIAMVVAQGCGKAQGGPEVKRYEAEFLTLFDTMTKIVGYSQSEEEFGKQVQFVHDELLTYHQLFDIYNTYEGINNIKTINDNAGIAPVKVDEKMIEFLEYCKWIYELTGGKVNIAFGSVLSIWHDYREAGIDDPCNAKLPPMEMLSEAAKHTDIHKLIIDPENFTVFLEDKDMSLDVGAIAKGYGVEKACAAAEQELGVKSMLVSLGGNVRAIGFKDHMGGKWSVGVQDPKDSTAVIGTVNLGDKESLVTSGDYQRYYVVDGEMYHHIIDPHTLMPAKHFKSVTILCKDSGLADGLSTCAYLMDFENSRSFIESLADVEALYVMNDHSVAYTENFQIMTE